MASHGSDTPTSPRAILHHTESILCTFMHTTVSVLDVKLNSKVWNVLSYKMEVKSNKCGLISKGILHTPPNSEIICGQNVSTKVVCGIFLFFKKKTMLKI